MVGTPVIIKHQDVTKENADKLRIGTISRAYFNEPDGWFYCEGIIWDEKAQDLIVNKNWSVSCSYDFLGYNDEGGEENNIHYDKEFTQLNFTHLAIVDNPRYERANIVFNSKDDEKGKWVTINGNHVFIPDGKTLDEVIKEKGWGEKGDTKDKSGDSGELEKEVKQLGQEASEAEELLHDWLETATEEEYKNRQKNEEFLKLRKDYWEKEEKWKKKYNELEDIKKEEKEKSMAKAVEFLYLSEGKKGKQSDSKQEKKEQTLDDKIKEHENKIPKNYRRDNQTKALWLYKNNYITRSEWEKSRINNSKEQDMALIEELKKLICKVENEKENEMEVQNEAVDKRKLIDEVAGIMKSAGCDDEVIRTAIGKMEKIGYDKSETDGKTDNKKVKNEDDEKDDKKEEVKNETDKKEEKVDNEEEKDEKEVKEVKEDVKKDVDNKCKNEKPDTTSFDKINAIYNSVKQLKETKTYVSRQEKLDNAVEYFK